MAFPSRLRSAALAASFLLALPAAGHATAIGGYTFQNFDVPGAQTETVANGVNNAGQIVGEYDGTGFLRNTDGSFTSIAPAYSIVPTGANGINNAGQIVGSFTDGNYAYGTFLRGADGQYTTVATPAAGLFTASGINDAGQIVGTGRKTGFVLNTDGTHTKLPIPAGADSVMANGINDAGQVVGGISGAGSVHGFVFDGATYTLLDDPFAAGSTVANAINSAGQIVGAYTGSDNNYHGFLDTNGAFITLDDPSAPDLTVNDPGAFSGTVALGISDAGTIVGYYYDKAGTHAFIATPTTDAVAGGASSVPEPASLALFGSAAALLGAFGRRRPA